MSDNPNIQPFAAQVIQKCGGPTKTARLAKRTPVSVHKWCWPKEKGGCAGIVPATAMENLLEAAKRGEVDLRREDFYVVAK